MSATRWTASSTRSVASTPSGSPPPWMHRWLTDSIIIIFGIANSFIIIWTLAILFLLLNASYHWFPLHCGHRMSLYLRMRKFNGCSPWREGSYPEPHGHLRKDRVCNLNGRLILVPSPSYAPRKRLFLVNAPRALRLWTLLTSRAREIKLHMTWHCYGSVYNYYWAIATEYEMWRVRCAEENTLSCLYPYPLKNRSSVMASPKEVRLDVEEGIELTPVAGELATESHEVSSRPLESVLKTVAWNEYLSELQLTASDSYSYNLSL